MDFALYQGLQGKPNLFESKAQNRQMEMQIMEAQNARSEAELAKSAEIDAKMQEYFNTINTLEVLDQDKERISIEEKKLQLDVLNKVKQFNGNLKNFAFGGGAATLQKYQSNLLESDAVKNAIANKTNLAQWQHAQANGMFVKEVGVDVPELNLETGQTETKRKVVTMNDAYEMFEKGIIDKLPYDGAEKDSPIGPEIFQQLYKDPRDPYSDNTNVTKQDVFLKLIEQGASKEQATYKANKYEQMIQNGGTEWRYKSGDKLKKRLMESQLATASLNRQISRAKLNATKGEGGGVRILNTTQRIKKLQVGQEEKIIGKELDVLTHSSGLNLTFDSKTGKYTPNRSMKVYDQYDPVGNPNPRSYDILAFDQVDPIAYVKVPAHKDPTTGENVPATYALKAEVTYLDKGYNVSGQPVRENMFNGTKFDDAGKGDPGEGVHVNNWSVVDAEGKASSDSWFSDDYYKGYVTIPIDQYITGFKATELNEANGLKNNAYAYPESGTITNFQEMQQGFKDKIDVAAHELETSLGVSYNQAVSMVMEWAAKENAVSLPNGAQAANQSLYE